MACATAARFALCVLFREILICLAAKSESGERNTIGSLSNCTGEFRSRKHLLDTILQGHDKSVVPSAEAVKVKVKKV